MAERATQYSELGVSAQKGDVKSAIANLDTGLYSDTFCKIIPDVLVGDPEYCMVSHSDTAGTKPSHRFMTLRETGNRQIIRDSQQDAIVMNTDDIGAAGFVDNIVLTSTIGRNPAKINAQDLKDIIEGGEDFLIKLRAMGIQIFNAGGETADVRDIVRTLDVGCTATSRMRRDEVVHINIQYGDVVVGLSGAGQAWYEDEYNSGIGSNGLTLARHGTLSHEYDAQYPECADPELDEAKRFRGKLRLTDKYGDLPLTVGELIASPTRTILPVLRDVLQHREGIHGIIHNSGGGLTKVNGFLGNNIVVVKDALMDIPPVFRMIQEQSGATWGEMFEVFNCGPRMEIYTTAARAPSIIRAAAAYNIEAQVIGRCAYDEKSGVIVKSEFGTFPYPKKITPPASS